MLAARRRQLDRHVLGGAVARVGQREGVPLRLAEQHVAGAGDFHRSFGSCISTVAWPPTGACVHCDAQLHLAAAARNELQRERLRGAGGEFVELPLDFAGLAAAASAERALDRRRSRPTASTTSAPGGAAIDGDDVAGGDVALVLERHAILGLAADDDPLRAFDVRQDHRLAGC